MGDLEYQICKLDPSGRMSKKRLIQLVVRFVWFGFVLFCLPVRAEQPLRDDNHRS
jgi:hypothetical protein